MSWSLVNLSDQTVDMFLVLLSVCKKKILERRHKEKSQLWVYVSRIILFLQIIFHAVISVLHHGPPEGGVGASLRLLSFNNNTHRFPCSAPLQQDVRSWCLQSAHWFVPLDTAVSLTISPFSHGLRSLPHLPNIVSAVSKWWQVGVEELSGPAILRKDGA